MTKNEFLDQIERLINTFGEQKWGNDRIDTLWRAVQTFSYQWLVNHVDKAILSSTDRYNFMEAIQYERIRLANEKTIKEISDHEKIQAVMITDSGLSNALKKFSANSLSEAIENSRPSNILKRGINE